MAEKTPITLQGASKKIFGDGYAQVKSSPIQWGIFTPYTNTKSKNGKVLYLKLIKVSTNLQTSNQIRIKVKNRFKKLIHEVQIYQVYRDYDYWYYLLEASENLISVQSFIQIKRNAQQSISQAYILRFLNFIGQLEKVGQSDHITFQTDQIGVDKQGKFVLANYQLYFTAINKSTQKQTKDIDFSTRQLLCKLLNPQNDNINLIQLYSFVKQNYSENIFDLVDSYILKSEYKISEIITNTQYSQEENTVLETTLTDSFASGQVVGEEVNTTFQKTASLEEGLLSAKGKKSGKKRKLTIVTIILLLVLIVVGAITFKYLVPKPLQCQQSQYLNQYLNQCQSCDKSCQTCSDGDQQSCLSCKQNLFIVKISKNARVGKCSNTCTGVRFQNNICIVTP